MIVGLALCHNCRRIEFMHDAGPFFYRCDECQSLVPKELQ